MYCWRYLKLQVSPIVLYKCFLVFSKRSNLQAIERAVSGKFGTEEEEQMERHYVRHQAWVKESQVKKIA